MNHNLETIDNGRIYSSKVLPYSKSEKDKYDQNHAKDLSWGCWYHS